jgi:sugar/nucleoside kinase (ribokinase family)
VTPTPRPAPRSLPLAVVGTLALDDVATPAGAAQGVLGGSATYFSVAASLFARVGLVGVVGRDFPERFRDLLARRDIDLAGLETTGGKTFHWSGRYEGDLGGATTLQTDLNVLETFAPRLPDAFKKAPFVFLANIAPKIQLDVLSQLESPRLVVADTMNMWIEKTRDDLAEVMRRVDGLMVNDAEAKALARESNLIAAGRRLLASGPKFVVVKKGEHGAFLFARDRSFALPSYPLDVVKDPTGAGDAFAGGLMGSLAASGEARSADVVRGMVYGTVTASYAVSTFSLEGLSAVTRADVEARAEELRRFVSF